MGKSSFAHFCGKYLKNQQLYFSHAAAGQTGLQGEKIQGRAAELSVYTRRKGKISFQQQKKRGIFF